MSETSPLPTAAALAWRAAQRISSAPVAVNPADLDAYEAHLRSRPIDGPAPWGVCCDSAGRTLFRALPIDPDPAVRPGRAKVRVIAGTA
jgi:hypothetical protein